MRRLLTSAVILLGSIASPAHAQESTKVLIVYASRTGNTESAARAVRDGAASVDGVTAVLRTAADVSDEEIAAAHAIIIGTPVHWGNVSVEAKQFIDRVGSTRPAHDGDRVAATFVTSGSHTNGNEFTRLAVLSSLLAMRFIAVGGETAEGRGSIGAQAVTGAADPGMSDEEIENARLLGARVARIAKELGG
jgi:NAD(P)H dehydrogenase (quinone)